MNGLSLGSLTDNGAPEKPAKKPFDRYLTIGFVGIFLLFVVGGIWAATAQVQGAIIAQGTIVVEGKPKTLQHLDGGIVGEILVKDGDRVEAGDVVIRLDPTAITANQDLLEARYAEQIALRARLTAERDRQPEIDWETIFPVEGRNEGTTKAVIDQDNLFKTRRRAYVGQRNQLRQRIEQQNDQINGFKSLIISRESQLPLVQKQLDGQRTLVAKGHVTKDYSAILQLEREIATLQGEIASFGSDIARAQNGIAETNIEILQVERTFQEGVLTDLRTAESQISDLREQLVTAKDQTARVDIKAPVSGIVHNMSVTTKGGVITPANPVMDIIPVNDRLIIEARIQPSEIDQVYVGQETRVRMSAFNQRTTPELEGVVISTSANTIIDQVTGAPFYGVKVEVPSDQIERLNGLVLVPGMPAEAYMQTDSRTVLNYLLKPASDQFKRAMREE